MPHVTSRTLRRSPGLILGVCLLALGCSDVLGPSSVAGTYVLARYDGAALPATVLLPPTSFYTMLADTLVFDRTGRGTLVTVYETELLTGTVERVRLTSPIRVQERSGQLYVAIDYHSCDRVECLPTPRHLLTPVGRTLFLRQGDRLKEYQPAAPAL